MIKEGAGVNVMHISLLRDRVPKRHPVKMPQGSMPVVWTHGDTRSLVEGYPILYCAVCH